ncbi:MAG: GIY-YIG nuclease family protein, partial [Crocinitomicaceae bacterium]
MKIQVDTPRFLEQIATDPGVYQFFNVDGVLLYVGKAKNLRKRVSSYFIKHHTDAKTRVLVKQIAHLSITLVQSEGDALLLENNLIKQTRPRYNILLKDDKTYPWICIRNEPFPRVFLTRKRFDSKDLYFGPYPKATTPKILLGLIREM